MDATERQVIDELFGKVKQAEGGSAPRDPQAEARIREHLAAQPAAPYYMAQAILIQEQALKASQARIEQLEADLAQRPAAGGGFLGGLFGGGAAARPVPAAGAPAAGIDPRLAAYNTPQQRAGGGFLGGAMQTAMGVAGGLLVGNALMSLFTPDAAAATEPAAAEPMAEPAADDAAYDAAPEDMDLGGFDEI